VRGTKGQDRSSDTSAVGCSVGWAISQGRRADGVRAGGFPGAERMFAQQAEGVASKRVGLLPQGRMPVREGAEIVDAQGRAIGKVSSGGFGPSLNAPLAMGYVPSELAGLGSEVTAMVRGKPVTLVVSKMPFVAQRYYRG
ncbi:glycine cleavage T C-terminal barrel domain-containing protein, partial [Pseudomonas aeruginosa]